MFARPIRGSAPGTMFARRFGSPRSRRAGCNCCRARFAFFAVVSPPLSFVPWRGADRIFSSLFRMIPTLPLIRPLSFRRSILSLVVVVCSRADLRVIASLFADRGNFEILLEERKRGFIIKAYCVQWLRENIALAIKFFSPNISLRIFIYASRG